MDAWPLHAALLFVIVVAMVDSSKLTANMQKPKLRDMSVVKDICLKDTGGNIEDIMYQYASLHGLARNKIMTAKFDSNIYTRLKKVFKLPLSLVKIVDVSKDCKDYEVLIDKRHCTFDRGFVQFIAGTDDVLLPKAHLQSWFYFYNCVKQLRQEFVLVDSLKQDANKILEVAEKHAREKKHLPSKAKPTFVGLVVKRIHTVQDYRGHDSWVPTVRYYQSAMDYFESNFDNVIYMVYADDVSWAKKNIAGGPFVYMESHSSELVLAVMSQCHHMIISPGAFSFWSAFLANGDTVYYKRKDETEDEPHYSYHKMDYYLPYWRPME